MPWAGSVPVRTHWRAVAQRHLCCESATAWFVGSFPGCLHDGVSHGHVCSAVLLNSAPPPLQAALAKGPGPSPGGEGVLPTGSLAPHPCSWEEFEVNLGSRCFGGNTWHFQLCLFFLFSSYESQRQLWRKDVQRGKGC